MKNFSIDCFVNAVTFDIKRELAGMSKDLAIAYHQTIQALYKTNVQTLSLLLEEFHKVKKVSLLYCALINVRRREPNNPSQLPKVVNPSQSLVLSTNSSQLS